MMNVGNEVSLSRLELVVLSRLASAKPPEPKELAEAVRAFALPAESSGRVRGVVTEVLAGLHRRGLVADERPRGRARAVSSKPARARSANKTALSRPAQPGRELTDHGRQLLCAVFELERMPAWKDIRNRHLPALALGLRPGSDEVSKALSKGETIVTAVLRRELDVPSASKVTALCDALIAEALGMPPGPITLSRIRAHVLAKRAGVEPKGEPEQIAARVALAALRTSRVDKRLMLPALGRRWASAVEAPPMQPRVPAPPVRGPAPVVPEAAAPVPPASPPAPAPRPSPPPGQPLSADALLTLVREAIPTIGADGRFGPEKVFISAIWHRIEGAGGELELSLERFKNWLLIANRDRLLDLARADLVGAMDPQLVAESEIEDLGSTFHFVLDRRVMARGAERRSHAG